MPVLVREGAGNGNSWNVDIGRMFNASDDAGLFVTAEIRCDDAKLLYESKCLWQFDHRYATYAEEYDSVTVQQKQNPHFSISTEYRIPKESIPSKFIARMTPWSLVYRIISNATNERTLVASVLPECGVLNSANLISIDSGVSSLRLLANLNAFVADFFCRNAMGGANLHRYIIQQLPILPPQNYWEEAILTSIIVPGALELVVTAHDLEAFAHACAYDGPPFRWDEERRFLIRCELDAAYFHLYGIERDDVDYIMETFPIVKRKDIARTEVKDNSGEVTQEGRYITKDTILEIYDEMAECIAANAATNSEQRVVSGDAANGERRVASGDEAAKSTGHSPLTTPQSPVTTGHSPLATPSNRVYKTRLDPPPGPPADADGNFLPLPQWLPGEPQPPDWPSHIHPPKEVVDEQIAC